MADARTFALRRQVNHLIRHSLLVRSYTTTTTSISTTTTSPTDPSSPTSDQTALLQHAVTYLRAEDQHALTTAKTHLDTLIASAHRIRSTTVSSPSFLRDTITSPPILHPSDPGKLRARHHFRPHPQLLPPYICAPIRAWREESMPRALGRAIEAAENIRNHLTDLQVEPYIDPPGRNAELEAWVEKVKRMDRKAMEEELEDVVAEMQTVGEKVREDAEELVRLGRELNERSGAGGRQWEGGRWGEEMVLRMGEAGEEEREADGGTDEVAGSSDADVDYVEDGERAAAARGLLSHRMPSARASSPEARGPTSPSGALRKRPPHLFRRVQSTSLDNAPAQTPPSRASPALSSPDAASTPAKTPKATAQAPDLLLLQKQLEESIKAGRF